MADEQKSPVIVTDVKMPFWSMVAFMVKAAIASIPALIILGLIGAVIGTVLAGVFQGMY